jgi:hypothetical protein
METINQTNFQAVFVNTNKAPIETQHIYWYTREINLVGDSPKIALIEVVREKYQHPDAENDAVIWLLNEHQRQITDKYNGEDLF